MKFNTDMNLIPDTPGVYLFYSSNKDTPIYVGKSIHLRQRIKSHRSGSQILDKRLIDLDNVLPNAGVIPSNTFGHSVKLVK